MQVYHELNDINKDLSLALGFFDGVHLGHRAVLNKTVEDSNLKSAVITFENHPKCFLENKDPQYILQMKSKLEIFESLGIDFVYLLDFEKLCNLSAFDYLSYLCENLAPKRISTGFNHFFGKNREGCPTFLRNNQKKFDYKYFEVPQIVINSQVISSSTIRENLVKGNIDFVNAMLGYNYFLEETVQEGEKIGRTLGFKTANLYYPKHLLQISRGVYKSEVLLHGKTYQGVANFGMRPSLNNTKVPVLEVHILDFDDDIYGENLKVSFIKKIRDEVKFNNLDELKNQISKDVKQVREGF